MIAPIQYTLLRDNNYSKELSAVDSADWITINEQLRRSAIPIIEKPKSLLVQGDSRLILPQLPDESVSCIITSPPYGGLKDYGSDAQMGFGQHCEEEYLPDLLIILKELFRITKSGGTLWMVLDTLKKGGETVSLPWEVISRARECGWTFHDLVVWDKGKSLPWSNRGRFRGVCEYILLMSKGKLTHFNLDTVRDTDNLSPYWIKYPERYHPDGKAPSDLWHFPIPNQGCWSKKEQLRHYCPFPVGLVARMVSISTVEGDVVFDPFSGTGSVITVASYLNRYGVGIEVNSNYVEEFDKTGHNSLVKQSEIAFPQSKFLGSSLRHIIIDLRMLKYAKTLFLEISRQDRLSQKAREYIGLFIVKQAVQTEENISKTVNSGDLGHIELQVLLRKGADQESVKEAITKQTNVKPLTLFGIKANVEIIPFESWNIGELISSVIDECWYMYSNGKFYKHDVVIPSKSFFSIASAEITDMQKKIPSIISKVRINLDSPSWE